MGCCNSVSRDHTELTIRQGCRLSKKHKGSALNIGDGGLIASGTGSVLCNAPILQSKSQFEIKILKKGPICVGIAGTDVDLNKPLAYQANSWVLSLEENKIIYGDEESVPLDAPVEVAIGDVIGCTFDEDNGMISFYHNGVPALFTSPLSTRKLRGNMHPAISVTPSAEVEAVFETADFAYPLEDRGFGGIIIARALI